MTRASRVVKLTVVLIRPPPSLVKFFFSLCSKVNIFSPLLNFPLATIPAILSFTTHKTEPIVFSTQTSTISPVSSNGNLRVIINFPLSLTFHMDETTKNWLLYTLNDYCSHPPLLISTGPTLVYFSFSAWTISMAS